MIRLLLLLLVEPFIEEVAVDALIALYFHTFLKVLYIPWQIYEIGLRNAALWALVDSDVVGSQATYAENAFLAFIADF